jgi:hypothetical protein
MLTPSLAAVRAALTAIGWRPTDFEEAVGGPEDFASQRR